MHGWTGKILRVDLSNSKITELTTQPYAEQYLGGRGIASRLYWEKVKPGIQAFDPENRLVFMTGPLTAIGAQAANRMAVVGKSPMTLPEVYCYGNIGGFFPAELKKAGWDGIVIDGRASRPVYLNVENSNAELLDAARLWGKGAYRVGEMLEETHGERIKYLSTGVAGENKVRTAVIAGSNHSTATGGFGAVLGSKNLKAICIRGTGKTSVAYPQRVKDLNRYTVRIGKRYRLAIPPIVERTGKSELLEVKGRGGCYQCAMECSAGIYRYADKLEGRRRCQSMEYYLPWRFDREDEPIETFFDAPTLANDYSIGTFELQGMIDWFYDCYKAGALTEEETGLPLSKIGTREFLEKLLHAIAYREGFGDILAEGTARAKEKVSPEARALFNPLVRPIGYSDMISPRAMVVHGLLYPMEPRVSQPIVHETAYLYTAWMLHREHPFFTPVTNKVVHDVAKKFWGSYEAGNLATYDGKAQAAKNTQDRTIIKDCLGLCDFAWPINYSFNTGNHVGDPALPSRIFAAVTGIEGEDFVRFAERGYNLQRAIMVREGRSIPEDDYPLEINFTERLGDSALLGKSIKVPGPGKKVVDTRGYILDRDKFADMLKEYYRLRGWDEATGLPLPETLARLGQDDLIASFKRR